ncbi:MAG: nucleoside-diphosphate kinase [Elusimicrobiaceae bacterium]|jgi:nucleoside-diphosphate kinase
MKERTLVLIKPDAISKRIAGLALDRLERLGLDLIAARVVHVSPELAREHYRHLKDRPFFDSLIDFMTGKFNPGSGGKVIALVFEGVDAVHRVREAAGATDPEKADPASIRGSLGRNAKSAIENVIHASESSADVEHEIALWMKPTDFAQ